MKTKERILKIINHCMGSFYGKIETTEIVELTNCSKRSATRTMNEIYKMRHELNNFTITFERGVCLTESILTIKIIHS